MALLNYKKLLNMKVVGIIVLLLLLWQVDIKKLGLALSKTDLLYIAGALAFMVIHVLLKIVRYHSLLQLQGIKISFFKTLHCSLAAFFLSFVTPGRVGEFAKAYFINKIDGGSKVKAFSGALVDRLCDVFILFFITILGISFLNLFGASSIIISLLLLFLLLSPSIVFFPKVRVCLLPIVERFTGVHHKLTWFQTVVSALEEMEAVFNLRLIPLLILSGLAYCAFFASCHLMLAALAVPLSFQKVVFFVSCASIISFLPISFAGIGTRDAGLVFFFTRDGLAGESALAFSFLIFICTYLFFGIAGFICFMTLDCSRKELMENS